MGLREFIGRAFNLVPQEKLIELQRDNSELRDLSNYYESMNKEMASKNEILLCQNEEFGMENDELNQENVALRKELDKVKKEIGSPKHFFELSPTKVIEHAGQDYSIEIRQVKSNEIIDMANKIIMESQMQNVIKNKRNLYVAKVHNKNGTFYTEIYGSLPEVAFEMDTDKDIQRREFYQALSIAADGRFNLPITQVPLKVEKIQVAKDIENYKLIGITEDPIIHDAVKRLETERAKNIEIEL